MEENKKELEEAKIGDEEIGEVDGGLDKTHTYGKPDYLEKHSIFPMKHDKFNESVQNEIDQLIERRLSNV